MKFPDVPNLPGVPALPRSPNFPPTLKAGLGLVQGMIWRIFQVQSQWGIFDGNGKALGDPAKFTGLAGLALETLGLGSALSTGSVDYSKETKVSDFPLERGGFASYNKVELPAAPTVTLCMGGSEANRRTFLDAIDYACKSTDLYSVVTPEVTYINFALERYNYQRRNDRGATLLLVEISLREVRQVSSVYSTATINKPKDAGATPPVDNGKVQAKTPETSTLKALANKLPALATKAAAAIQNLVK